MEFSPDEMRRWAYAGVDRRVSAIAKKRKGAHGFDRDDFWQLDLEGLLAEAAVAKALNVYFNPATGTLDTDFGDVMKGVQVRSTKYDNGNLLLHDSDSDSDRFVLVTGSSGKYVIRGWIRGENGKDESLKRQHKGRWAYWVPQSMLLPFAPKGMQPS